LVKFWISVFSWARSAGTTNWVLRVVLVSVFVALDFIALAGHPVNPKPPLGLENADTFVRFCAGVVDLVVAISGIPVAYFLISKTKSEIRKLELVLTIFPEPHRCPLINLGPTRVRSSVSYP
jgi:hypothetical protein